MKFFSTLFLISALGLIHSVQSLNGYCGGACISSDECAENAGDQNCRCSYFQCRELEGACGGGCITNRQCSDWSGDLNCICGTLYECVDRHLAESRSYQAYAKFMLSVRGSAYQKKVKEMLSLQATKTKRI